ncbi:hypothetical protein NPIL_122871 [Nephila pilipes]|uniref:Uncharacterized protein n=1 Tax=Nephila pilipes TaxID=299642 RepID=A0A8X6I4P7_NEPPI|nr:hypothetical protein NPIL_122871 [Nephila pilipes]
MLVRYVISHQTHVHHSTKETAALYLRFILERHFQIAQSKSMTKKKIGCFGWERLDSSAVRVDMLPSDFHQSHALIDTFAGYHILYNTNEK